MYRNQRVEFLASENGMWWRTLVAAFDASGFNHNDPRGGFQAARPELATYGKGGARFRDFRYRRLERL